MLPERNAADAAALLMEAATRRERRRDPDSPVDLETIHERARLAATAASGVKAEDVKILDMHELVSLHRLPGAVHRPQLRLTKRIAEEVGFKLKQADGHTSGRQRGRGRRRVDPARLPGFHGARVHARGAGVLPAGRAVEAGAGRDGRMI